MRHSQKMKETPLHPWAVVEKTGNIACAHCNCMAGLGESCSHIGEVFFYIEYAVKLRDSKTCTEEKAYWLLPGYRDVEYKQVAEIDFTSAKSLKINLEKQAKGIEAKKTTSTKKLV